MLVFGLGPWSSWRAPQMRSPVQPRPSCHAPHSGYGHRGLVVDTENRCWDGKNSRCQIGHESLMFMAAVVILLTGQRYRRRQDWVLATHWQRLHLGIFTGFQTSTMIVEESRNFRIEAWASRFPGLDGIWMVTMGNAAGCSVCGSDILLTSRGSDTDSKHQGDLDRAAGSGCVNDESMVRSWNNGVDHQLFSWLFLLRMSSVKHVNLVDWSVHVCVRVRAYMCLITALLLHIPPCVVMWFRVFYPEVNNCHTPILS